MSTTDASSTPALTVHHLRVSQSERILFLLEELSIPYNLTTHIRSPILSPPELVNLPGNPLGAAPVLIDTSAPLYSPSSPLVLAESAAIAEYIMQRHGSSSSTSHQPSASASPSASPPLSLGPAHPRFADYTYWFHFANGNLQPSIFMLLQMSRAVPEGDTSSPSALAFARLQKRFQTLLKHMDDHLTQKGPWLAGDDFTAADVMCMFSVTTMRVFYPFSLVGFEGIVGWIGRVCARDGYQRAMRKGDPDLADGRCCRAEPPERFGALVGR